MFSTNFLSSLRIDFVKQIILISFPLNEYILFECPFINDSVYFDYLIVRIVSHHRPTQHTHVWHYKSVGWCHIALLIYNNVYNNERKLLHTGSLYTCTLFNITTHSKKLTTLYDNAPLYKRAHNLLRAWMVFYCTKILLLLYDYMSTSVVVGCGRAST